jgi:hypothetical protein
MVVATVATVALGGDGQYWTPPLQPSSASVLTICLRMALVLALVPVMTAIRVMTMMRRAIYRAGGWAG